MYVAIEGIDTSGKSTQIQALKLFFKKAIFTFEPGATNLGVRLREILLQDSIQLDSRAEMLLFLADRAQHANEILQSHANNLIIADRSLISGMAYAKDFDFDTLKTFNLFATQGILPNKVIILELQKDDLQKRLNSKGNDKIEQRGLEYLLSLQERIKSITQKLSLEHRIINANLPKDSITKQIVDFIGKENCVV
ncbi:dTMP kinase [Helicobacter canadensis]|uniref:Thymidylate kinase n=1 Tax=Helicobacter canadensis MIT 98-5491 TaxID=537970 RepID=C5ZWJ4_9HELI|nr:dTMP kinase [Helicobacter canadensis]EES89512.1 thymidylate kinase [Helicobacter canadensis MIT 98-5491]EFR48303.1 dTMP kinase [Helicobacter canadensis MIT 98-5491]STO99550.1 thymidylate kinase [Helicobacter canadensis]